MSAPLPPDLTQVDPAEAWQPWMHDQRQRFDAKWAGHLFRRAAFGASPDELRKAVRDGLDATLDRLFTGDPRAAARLELLDATGEEFARADETDKLRAWWVSAMLHGGHPLREKMVLFWHNHFATSVAKVKSGLLIFRQNQLLRMHALGRFGPLLTGISRDPAMLAWLDSNANVKSHPNENFAREVMELFTLGVGNYTEKDVREAARAFTGWHVDGEGERFQFDAAEHDDGPKTILGRTGRWDGDDVLRLLMAQPTCAKCLAAKLYRYFVSETDPPKALLEPLADQLRRSDYDIGAAVRTILRSRLFFSDHAYRKRIKSPVEHVLGTAKAAWPGPSPSTGLAGWLVDMGQSLFAPPNVKGWTGGKNWLTDATILARHNFAEFVITPTERAVIPERGSKAPTISYRPAPIGVDVYSPEPTERMVRLLEESENYRSARQALPILIGSAGNVASQLAATGLPGGSQPPPVLGPPPRVVSGPDRVGTTSASIVDPTTDALWYVRKMKAQSPAAVVRAVGEQFFPGGLPEQVREKLEAFLGPGGRPVTQERVREVIHAVLCLPEYQLC
jgi:Protein of unknown function (DUF1800)